MKRTRAGRTQTALAKRHGMAGQGNLSQYEGKLERKPTAALVEKHAGMIGCPTWELMLGVVTAFDRVRFPPDLNEAQLEGLLAGIALMEKEQRETLAEEGSKALTAFLSKEALKQAQKSKLATQAKASRKNRRQKSA